MNINKVYRKINDILCRKQNIFILFPVGFIMGIICGCFFSKQENVKKIVEQTIALIKDISVYYPLYLCYVLFCRVKWLVAVLTGCFLPIGPYMYCGVIFFLGIAYGFVIVCFAGSAGFTGIAFCIISLFPHGICYAIILYYGYDLFCLGWFYLSKTDRPGQYFGDKRMIERTVLGKGLLVLTVVAIIGVVTECYVNPFFLKNFVKLFL